MGQYRFISVDAPADKVRRITLNDPDKRNALNNILRGELFAALEVLDRDPSVNVTILRGAGEAFCAGYNLGPDNPAEPPFYTAGKSAGYRPGEYDGQWARHVVEGCFRMWDLAKPVIAQVHGYCLAGGTELAAACDLVYVAEDAKIGYPVVRAISPPDNQAFPWLMGMRAAMEMMLTGDAMSGTEAVERGFANRAFPATELEGEVLKIAQRVAQVPPELQQINKRAVHRQMEIMGIRAGIRAGTELQALAMLSPSTQRHFEDIQEGLTKALTKRDEAFGDYRTSSKDSKK